MPKVLPSLLGVLPHTVRWEEREIERERNKQEAIIELGFLLACWSAWHRDSQPASTQRWIYERTLGVITLISRLSQNHVRRISNIPVNL